MVNNLHTMCATMRRGGVLPNDLSFIALRVIRSAPAGQGRASRQGRDCPAIWPRGRRPAMKVMVTGGAGFIGS
ncbi:MAG TPA: hypothetical protein VJ890_22110, partial [Vineibacter sp.]|nr:hypothetical protein [Vineibacter sp.]